MTTIIGAPAPSDQEKRLSHVEQEVGRLQVGMHAFREKTESQLNDISTQVTKLADGLSATTRTPWALIFSGAVLITIFIGMAASISSLVTGHLADQDDALDRRLLAIEELALERGGKMAGQTERIAALERQLETRISLQDDLLARVNRIDSTRYTQRQAAYDYDHLKELFEARVKSLQQ